MTAEVKALAVDTVCVSPKIRYVEPLILGNGFRRWGLWKVIGS